MLCVNFEHAHTHAHTHKPRLGYCNFQTQRANTCSTWPVHVTELRPKHRSSAPLAKHCTRNIGPESSTHYVCRARVCNGRHFERCVDVPTHYPRYNYSKLRRPSTELPKIYVRPSGPGAEKMFVLHIRAQQIVLSRLLAPNINLFAMNVMQSLSPESQKHSSTALAHTHHTIIMSSELLASAI